ncbi:MAG: phosphoribosyl-AMP cyclohydrolase, partial [Anaerolineae bacterium]|nr:phosphoribosyl-AMP cyclohydrolase [Anaerolineae bacterium]
MTIIDELNWNDQGLLPAIVQDSDTDRVLMLAWVNEAALRQTFLTGEVHFWSRSR